jgi:uncharacterized membrane protein
MTTDTARLTPDPSAQLGSGTDRLRALSDGVFAIAITLLILEFRAPHLADPGSGAELLRQLAKLWPNLLSYLISFFMLGIYWVGHRNVFEAIERSDRSLLWLNNFFLLGVSFLPFPAAILGQYHANALALTLYGANLATISLFLFLLFAYAGRHRHLLGAHVTPGLLSAGRIIILTPFAFYSLAAVAAFVAPKLSLLIFMALPVLYVSPGTLEAVVRWRSRVLAADVPGIR